jgi:hypothetical protein
MRFAKEAFMRKEPKNIAEHKKPSNDAFASVARSFGEANNRFQALGVESVRRAVEIQSQFITRAYDTYISEMSKLGRIVGYSTFTPRPQSLPYANLNEKKAVNSQQRASAEAKVQARPRTAAQTMPTKRKTGTVATSQSGSKRSAKAKRKAGSVRRGKS